MVHYDPDSIKVAQNLPPVCPRCGNHRTEIVGLSDDGRTMTIRCNACGERSRVEAVSAGSHAAMSPRADDDGADEINVMRVVGRALAALSDPQARMRVLRWATERFQPVSTADVLSPGPDPLLNSDDQGLSVDRMEEFFADAGDVNDLSSSAPDPLAHSGDKALSVDGVEALFADACEVEMRTSAAPTRPAVPEQLESLVEGFVSDFQRVAIQWNAV